MYSIVKDWGDSILLIATCDSEIKANEIAEQFNGYVRIVPHNPTPEQIELARNPWSILLLQDGTVHKCERQEAIAPDSDNFYSKFHVVSSTEN